MTLYRVFLTLHEFYKLFLATAALPLPPVLLLEREKDAAAINLIFSSLNYFQQIKQRTTVMDRLPEQERWLVHR